MLILVDRAYGNNKMFILPIRVGGGVEFMCQPQFLFQPQDLGLCKGGNVGRVENVREVEGK